MSVLQSQNMLYAITSFWIYSDASTFVMSYQLCKNSHHFCFQLETKVENLIIEKIIIIQSRSMFYVNNMCVPYDMPPSGYEYFYVDSHLFTMFVEQPIIVIYHRKDNEHVRYVEEHHFKVTYI